MGKNLSSCAEAFASTSHPGQPATRSQPTHGPCLPSRIFFFFRFKPEAGCHGQPPKHRRGPGRRCPDNILGRLGSLRSRASSLRGWDRWVVLTGPATPGPATRAANDGACVRSGSTFEVVASIPTLHPRSPFVRGDAMFLGSRGT